MTTLQVPGFNVSILRQQTFTQKRVPLLITGRVSLLGLPVPATVRVSLEGPSYAPEVTNFDTIAAPTGDYAIPIIADQDGQYTVTARAYPIIVPPLPIPGLPSPIDLLPPAAESPSPPVAVGDRINGFVQGEGPDGVLRTPVPPQTPIEISAPISFAPFIPITIGAPGGAPGFGPAPFFPPLAPPPQFPAPAPTPAPAVPPPVVFPPLPPPTEPPPEQQVVRAQVVSFVLE